jgi:alpha-beta hydrolase superfamily lysophospholipase
MGTYHDLTTPAGLRTRGTVLVLPGRGESQAGYARFGARLAADAYRVRILPPPAVGSGDLTATLSGTAAALTAAVEDLDPVRPLVLAGADTGAAVLAALLARPALDAAWWPEAVVLAGLPGYDGRQGGGWEEELDARTHCPVHRGLLTEDPAVAPGSLADPVPAALLDAAYGSTADVPHLLLSGDADPLAGRDDLIRLAKSLPSARLSLVRGGHHDVLNDLQHRSVAAEIVTFLEAVRLGSPPEPIIEVVAGSW